jgi:hypothetical protein
MLERICLDGARFAAQRLHDAAVEEAEHAAEALFREAK